MKPTVEAQIKKLAVRYGSWNTGAKLEADLRALVRRVREERDRDLWRLRDTMESVLALPVTEYEGISQTAAEMLATALHFAAAPGEGGEG